MASSLAPIARTEPYGRVVVRAALWLAFLAPFFYLSYGFANWLASRRDEVGSIVFSW
ncbi:MAG: serine/threonine protein phosphatase, partial [Mesorhizobium sp.]